MKEKNWFKNLMVKRHKCSLCLELIPKGEEWSEAQLLSPTLGQSMFFHQYCWERYNEKVKWKMITRKLWEAQELAEIY